jgi:hypothetical protein
VTKKIDIAKNPKPEAEVKVYYYCSDHTDSVLECNVCKGKEGGLATLRKYGTEKHRIWGALGGRPRKNNKKKSRKKKAA